MIDRLARRNLGGVVDRAEQREAAIAEMIAGRAIVDEADDLVPELTAFENSVGDEASQLARSGDENPLEADAGAPAPLEDFAHDLARREGERDVQDQEDRPGGLRDFERAAIPRGGRGEVNLDVRRRHDAEDDGEDAPDEDGEEIVDARMAAAQAIQSLQLKADRNEHRDERQQIDVLLERRRALRRGNEARVEPEEIRDEKRDDRERRVRQHVGRHEQAVVAVQHAVVSAISAVRSSANRRRPKRSA